jgi:hypothetical protein
MAAQACAEVQLTGQMLCSGDSLFFLFEFKIRSELYNDKNILINRQ